MRSNERDFKRRCVVCGRATNHATYTEHHSGMHVDIPLCDRHNDVDTAKRATLEWRQNYLAAIAEWERGSRLCVICEELLRWTRHSG